MATEATTGVITLRGRMFQIVARCFPPLVLLLSAVDIIGWMFNIEWIKHPINGIPSLQSATALAFFISAVSVLFLNSPVMIGRILGRVLAFVVLLGGLATFFEHLLERNWNLNFPLWKPAIGHALSFPGPMAPDVSFTFIILGSALVLLSYERRRLLFASKLSAASVALLNILILCAGPHFCAFFGCLKFSFFTAGMFLLLSFALLFQRADTGITRIFTTNTAGGNAARVIFVGGLSTILLTFLVRMGESADLYDSAVGNLAIALFALVGFVLSLYFVLRKVDTTEEEKAVIEAQKAIVEAEKNKAEMERIQLEEEKSELQQRLSESMTTDRPAPRLKRVCLECGNHFQDLSIAICPDCEKEIVELIDTELAPGTMFAERYEILRALGSGGISTVYLAKQRLMNKNFALKVLHSHLASTPKAVQRFQREAQTLSLLPLHPNLLGVHDFGLSPDGQAYLIMDYLEGVSLEEYLDEVGIMNWRQAVPLFLQLCSGLQLAHSHGVVHRDLKPSNVMLTRDANRELVPKLVDFGMAKGDMQEVNKLTQTGEVLGTPLYMSPEQCAGIPQDARSDIYSMGCLMFECLSDGPPFVGKDVMDTIKQHLFQPIPSFRKELQVPDWIEVIVIKALAKERELRQQSVQELYESLEQSFVCAMNQ